MDKPRPDRHIRGVKPRARQLLRGRKPIVVKRANRCAHRVKSGVTLPHPRIEERKHLAFLSPRNAGGEYRKRRNAAQRDPRARRERARYRRADTQAGERARPGSERYRPEIPGGYRPFPKAAIDQRQDHPAVLERAVVGDAEYLAFDP